MPPDPSCLDAIKSRATALGFLACGITTLDPVPHAAALDRWLARGFAGTMRYLHRQALRRKNPGLIVERARSAVVVLDNYLSGTVGQWDRGTVGAKIAKYAQGRDYHLALKERLELLAGLLREQGAKVARSYTDAGPVPERELAQRAGLGWIGKNTMLIRPGVGSFFFIGAVFTDLALTPDLPFEMDHCGTCTKCLDACPTAAFPEPRVLDATQCISYWTIESKEAIPPEVVSQLGGWAFGCDICNDVCPWNTRFAVPAANPNYQPREALRGAGPEYFERMTEEEFAQRFGDTPLERAGLEGMRRNWKAVWQS